MQFLRFAWLNDDGVVILYSDWYSFAIGDTVTLSPVRPVIDDIKISVSAGSPGQFPFKLRKVISRVISDSITRVAVIVDCDKEKDTIVSIEYSAMFVRKGVPVNILDTNGIHFTVDGNDLVLFTARIPDFLEFFPDSLEVIIIGVKGGYD